MQGARILVVDDEEDVRTLVRVLLERAGFERERGGRRARGAAPPLRRARPTSSCSTSTMPELDGWQTLERIRDLSDVPVLMLTARAAELDKVRGLRGGADDYVTKPFGRQELLARVDALLRRAAGPPEVARGVRATPRAASTSPRREVLGGRQRGRSSRRSEFRLLGAFVRHPNQVLSPRPAPRARVGDTRTTVATDQVKLYVGYLRRKLGWDAAVRSPLETVRGFGYRYRPPGADSERSPAA